MEPFIATLFPPQPGRRWRLITINAKGTWLPGDPRGFRDRRHRIRSSGDYRNPPPQGEHGGLYVHSLTHLDRDPVRIPREARPDVGNALAEELFNSNLQCLSVFSDHAHLVLELPDDPKQIKTVIGNAKRLSSRAIKRDIPGAVWSGGCGYQAIDDPSHLENAIRYVLIKQGAEAWTWERNR